MTKKSNLIIVLSLLLIGVFGYLTQHHFHVKLGMTEASLCQINAQFNCDTAALSSFSEVFGLPIAALGLAFSVYILLTSLLLKLNWIEETPTTQWVLKFLTGFSALGSVFLLGVSLFVLKSYCPFCIVSYVLLFALAYCVWTEFDFAMNQIRMENFVTDQKFIFSLILIPLGAWFISSSYKDSLGLTQLEKLTPERIYFWQNAPVQNFDITTGLIKNPEGSKATIVEFADFKCPHCKTAAMTLKTFLASRSDVKLVFKPFPLDGTCNNSISQKGDGTRCTLAGIALCADKLFQKGWEAHYWIFDRQEELFETLDLDPVIKTLSQEYGLDAEQMISCSKSEETFQSIRKMAEEGNAAKVEGTPSIYINNRKLDGGQVLNILKSAVDTL